MTEFVIHTYAAVDENGLTVVSPEVISNLIMEVITNDHQNEYQEGEFGLAVKYDDLKELIEMAGHSVKEITLEKPE